MEGQFHFSDCKAVRQSGEQPNAYWRFCSSLKPGAREVKETAAQNYNLRY